MSSGIKVAKDLEGVFEELKMKKQSQKKRKFLVLKISEKNDFIVEDTDFKSEDEFERCPSQEDNGLDGIYKDFLDSLPKSAARYIIFDYAFRDGTVQKSKLINILWCPENLSIKEKMMYAASKDALKALTGGDCLPYFQADSIDDCSDSVVKAKLCKFS